MKKGSIVSCYKKGDKQSLKNYRPVSLLPVSLLSLSAENVLKDSYLMKCLVFFSG